MVEGYTERRILEKFYAVGLRTEPALIVRGSSRRITIMRFRPANIRVINRRENYLDHDLRCLLRAKPPPDWRATAQVAPGSLEALFGRGV